MRLEKVGDYVNPTIRSAIASTINEYDIAACHPTVMRFIAGEDEYKRLMAKDKLERNSEIGRMIRTNPDLYNQISVVIVELLNEFIEINGVQSNQLLSTTRDSLVLLNKIPKVTMLREGKVEFKNKMGSFSSYYNFNHKQVYADPMRGVVRIKGVNEEKTDSSPFVQKYYLQLLAAVESRSTLGPGESMKILEKYRKKYIESRNLDIYRELDNNNLFTITVDGEVFHSDSVPDERNLIKTGNYINYVMPVLQLALKAR